MNDYILELPETVYKGKEIVAVYDTRFPLAFLTTKTYKVDDKEFFTVWGAKRYIRRCCK